MALNLLERFLALGKRLRRHGLLTVACSPFLPGY
jgi:hypothetical protein